MIMGERYNKNYRSDGRSAEDRALDRFAEMMIEKISSIKEDWKSPGLRRVRSVGQGIFQVGNTMV